LLDLASGHEALGVGVSEGAIEVSVPGGSEVQDGAGGGGYWKAMEPTDVAAVEAGRVMQVQARSAMGPAADHRHVNVVVATTGGSEPPENRR
jgi:hypothetical protein